MNISRPEISFLLGVASGAGLLLASNYLSSSARRRKNEASAPRDEAAAHSLSHLPNESPSDFQTNTQGSSSSSHPPLPQLSPNLQFVFIRHGESENNALSDFVEKKYGKSPYNPSATDAFKEYEELRSPDPRLSERGLKQAESLPRHPLVVELRLHELSTLQGRVRLFAAPLQRAIQTALPLVRHLDVNVVLRADLCEYGGHYSGHGNEQKATPGRTRAELAAAFPQGVDVSEVSEQGWWQSPSPKFERTEDFEKRLERVLAWMRQLSVEYKHQAQQWKKNPVGKPPADYVVVISHADFLTSLISRALRVAAAPTHYVFVHENSAGTHIEGVVPERDARNRRFDDEEAQTECEDKEQDPFYIRVRRLNVAPAKL